MLIFNNQPDRNDLSVTPEFFRIYLKEDKDRLEKLIALKTAVNVNDQIDSHIDELIKSRHPQVKKSDTGTIERLREEFLRDKGELLNYGVWIYYPWNNTLVHCLDEEEFIEVRTNRNRYKITDEEQAVLRSKKIGVVGLSVGQSIALTMAMERTCGELRLADFDIAELSNLNRLRTGIHNIGLSKTVIAAREIAEIDPFLTVKIFNDGLTQDNIDEFFTGGGKLDLLIEVCDGLDIKIESRFKARELNIPVVMDTNDRGMLDVERFDLEPERPILHGLAEGLNPDNIKGLTNEQKIPYVLKMIGIDSISTRLKASMLEVEQSINTWPQLASSVVLGGALTTDVSRRILLDQYHDSGRYYVDLDELVGNQEKPESGKSVSENPYRELDHETIRSAAENYLERISPPALQLTSDQLGLLLNAAIAAPSAGNNQPWKWTYKSGVLFLFHDKIKSYSWGDYYEMGSHMALGAALENVNIQAQAIGLDTRISLLPQDNIAAALEFSISASSVTSASIRAAENIYKRYTNRKLGKRQEINESFYGELKPLISDLEGINLLYTDNEADLLELGDIIAECDKVRMLNQLGHEEFYSEIRWTKEEAEASGDGIELRAVDITPSEAAGFRVARDWDALQLLAELDQGNGFKKMSKNAVEAASAIIVISIPDFNHLNLIKAGRAAEKIWINATKNNISVHPMLSPAFFFNRLLHGKGIGLTEKSSLTLTGLRERFLSIFPKIQSGNEAEVFIMKVSLSEDIGVRSLRKTKEEIFINI